MKPLKRRLVLCILPVVIGIILIGIAFWNYTQEPITIAGKPLTRPSFRLGVDLVGGTILVYEIDPDKKPENYNKEQLVAALKRRLDPADLYNITIRPLSDTRVEIILPTGGHHRDEAEKQKWNEWLDKVASNWKLDKTKLEAVRRGDKAELAQKINELDSKIPPGDIDKFIGDNWTAEKERALTAEGVE